MWSTSAVVDCQAITESQPQEELREATSDDLPTLEVCRRAIWERVSDRERRFRSLDTKAGLILGFTGLIVGFATQSPNPGSLELAGQAAAVAAGFFAALVLICRRGFVTLEPDKIADLASLPPWAALEKIIGTTLWAYDKDTRWLKIRTWLLLASALMLVAALVLLVLGTGLRVK